MANAYCYHRFSSSRQDKGMSIERQAERTRELCKRKGWTILETLEDKGRSAWKGDHLRVGKLGEFKRRVDVGEIEPGSYLVIENLDRLSRQEVKLARRWIEDVTDRGIIVAVCSPEILLDSEALSGSNIVSMIQYLMEANRSTSESARKSEMMNATVGKFLNKARDGIVYSARAPSWLKAEKNSTFKLIEERVAIVNQIYEWCADGLGVHSIARKLNDTVAPWSPGRTRKPSWKHGYIRDLLLSPAVEGEYHVRTGEDRTPTGEVILGYYPRIVSADLVERARTALKQRAGTGGAGRTEAANLFAGRIRCAHCGDAMVRVVQGKGDKRYEYLKCSRFNAGGGPRDTDTPEQRSRKCVNGTQYRYDLFERAALAQILHLALDNSFFIQSDDISPLAGRIADLRKEATRKEAEQRRLLSFIMRNDDATEAEELLNALRPQLKDARTELAKAEAELERAKGKVSPDEHLRRVLEVRESIYSDDPEEREQARRKVRDAVQSIVSVVQCCRVSPDPDARPYRATPGREIIMALAGGYMAYRFDGTGKLLNKLSLEGTDLMVGLAGIGAEDAIAAIRRRVAAQ